MTVEEMAYYDSRFRAGLKEGEKKGVFKTLFSLMHKGQISIQVAAKVSELTEIEISAAYQEWCDKLESTDK